MLVGFFVVVGFSFLFGHIAQLVILVSLEIEPRPSAQKSRSLTAGPRGILSVIIFLNSFIETVV